MKEHDVSGKPFYTGHSLGGGLALYTAVKLGGKAHVFSAADPWKMFSKEEQSEARRKAKDFELVDFRSGADKVTGLTNHLTTWDTNKSAVVAWCGNGREELGHGLKNFVFDSTGNVKTELVYELEALRAVPEKLETALSLMRSVKTANNSIPDRMQRAYQELRNQAVTDVGWFLSNDEIDSILENDGWRPTEHYDDNAVGQSSNLADSVISKLTKAKTDVIDAADKVEQADLVLAAAIGASTTQGPPLK